MGKSRASVWLKNCPPSSFGDKEDNEIKVSEWWGGGAQGHGLLIMWKYMPWSKTFWGSDSSFSSDCLCGCGDVLHVFKLSHPAERKTCGDWTLAYVSDTQQVFNEQQIVLLLKATDIIRTLSGLNKFHVHRVVPKETHILIVTTVVKVSDFLWQHRDVKQTGTETKAGKQIGPPHVPTDQLVVGTSTTLKIISCSVGKSTPWLINDVCLGWSKGHASMLAIYLPSLEWSISLDSQLGSL